MVEFVEFKGLKHYPLGNAKLEIIDDQLKISNIGDSGLDGVSIRTEGNENWEASFAPLEITNEKGYTVSYLGKDDYGRIKTIGQQAVCLTNVDEEYPLAISTNSLLFSKKITLTGELNGETTFEEEFENPAYQDMAIPWVAILAILIFIVENTDYSIEIHKDGNGCIIKTVEKFSIGGAGRGTTEQNPFKAPNGQTFNADKIYLKSEFEFPEPLPPENFLKMEEVQIMAKNLDEMVITNETYS